MSILRLRNYITQNKKALLAILFFIHFFLIIVYSTRDIVALSITEKSYLSNFFSISRLRAMDYNLSRALLHTRSSTKENYMGLYLTLTGAQTSFTYFVGNADVEKMIFDLEFKDGTHQVILPEMANNEIALRFKHILSIIKLSKSEAYRDLLVKRITEYETKSYPDLKSVTTIFGKFHIPVFTDYQKNKDMNFKCLYQYHYQIK